MILWVHGRFTASGVTVAIHLPRRCSQVQSEMMQQEPRALGLASPDSRSEDFQTAVLIQIFKLQVLSLVVCVETCNQN